jgi:hypothetical protein
MSRRPTLRLRPPRRNGSREEEPPPSVQQPPPDILPGGRPLFGEWLVRQGVLTREQLLRALALSHQHEWRLGDAVVVLRFASRARVEAEAELFGSHVGRREPRARQLERRAQRLEREAAARRATRVQ